MAELTEVAVLPEASIEAIPAFTASGFDVMLIDCRRESIFQYQCLRSAQELVVKRSASKVPLSMSCSEPSSSLVLEWQRLPRRFESGLLEDFMSISLQLESGYVVHLLG